MLKTYRKLYQTVSIKTLKERLKLRKNFWIMKFQTLALHGLNQELN